MKADNEDPTQTITIAEAALKYYFEETNQTYLFRNDPRPLQRIAYLAGYSHCNLSSQVIFLVAKSSYWTTAPLTGFHSDIPNPNGSTLYRPTVSGIDHYYNDLGCAFTLFLLSFFRFFQTYPSNDVPNRPTPTFEDRYGSKAASRIWKTAQKDSFGRSE